MYSGISLSSFAKLLAEMVMSVFLGTQNNGFLQSRLTMIAFLYIHSIFVYEVELAFAVLSSWSGPPCAGWWGGGSRLPCREGAAERNPRWEPNSRPAEPPRGSPCCGVQRTVTPYLPLEALEWIIICDSVISREFSSGADLTALETDTLT